MVAQCNEQPVQHTFASDGKQDDTRRLLDVSSDQALDKGNVIVATTAATDASDQAYKCRQYEHDLDENLVI